MQKIWQNISHMLMWQNNNGKLKSDLMMDLDKN